MRDTVTLLPYGEFVSVPGGGGGGNFEAFRGNSAPELTTTVAAVNREAVSGVLLSLVVSGTTEVFPPRCFATVNLRLQEATLVG